MTRLRVLDEVGRRERYGLEHDQLLTVPLVDVLRAPREQSRQISRCNEWSAPHGHVANFSRGEDDLESFVTQLRAAVVEPLLHRLERALVPAHP